MMSMLIKDFHEISSKFKRKDYLSNNQIHWFSHRVSPYLSYILIRLRVSADLATILFLISGLVGAFLVLNPITSYLLWRLHILLDMSDGDIARFNNSFSKRGKYWDRLNHSIINPLYCLTISFSYYEVFQDMSILLAGLALIFAQNLLMNAKYFYPDTLETSSLRYSTNMISSWVRNVILDLLGMEGILLYFLLGSYYHSVFTVFLGLMFFALVTLMIAIVKIYYRSYRDA